MVRFLIGAFAKSLLCIHEYFLEPGFQSWSSGVIDCPITHAFTGIARGRIKLFPALSDQAIDDVMEMKMDARHFLGVGSEFCMGDGSGDFLLYGRTGEGYAR